MLLIPSLADAWGPLTHIYLGYQVIDFGAALVPAGIYAIIKKYRNDFLYGNLSADIILGRRFQTFETNSHSWDIAWKLLGSSKTDRQKAFAYGYLMHL
ncbi:MAG: zinc dependent phospholipase C family protein, partial [Nitrospirota bacterium]